MGDSDALIWTMTRDPVLRSPIVVVILLDRVPNWDDVSDRLERLTEWLPRLRSRAVPRPPGGGNPRWELDPDFAVSRHLRVLGTPPPGTLRSVLDVAQSMGTAPFDPELPLWEAAAVVGLQDDSAALVLKVHHSVVDGMAGIDTLLHILDRRRTPAADRSASRIRSTHPPAPDGSGRSSAAGSTSNQALSILSHCIEALSRTRSATTGFLTDAVAAASHPASTLTGAMSTARSMVQLLAPAPTPLSPLLTGRGIERHFEVLDLPEAALHRSAGAMGCTMNDVFVAGVLGGMKLYHDIQGSTVKHLRGLLPISIRTASDPAGGNRFVPTRFVLDARISDPSERIRHVHGQTEGWKHNPALEMSNAVAYLLNRLPPVMTRLTFGAMLKGGDFVATNVPGPPFATYLAGARVNRIYGFAPPSGAAVNVALLTTAGRGCIGINADMAAVPDTTLLAKCIRRGLLQVTRLPAGPAARPLTGRIPT